MKLSIFIIQKQIVAKLATQQTKNYESTVISSENGQAFRKYTKIY